MRSKVVMALDEAAGVLRKADQNFGLDGYERVALDDLRAACSRVDDAANSLITKRTNWFYPIRIARRLVNVPVPPRDLRLGVTLLAVLWVVLMIVVLFSFGLPWFTALVVVQLAAGAFWNLTGEEK